MELKQHMAREHAEELGMSRAQRREALTIPLQFSVSRALAQLHGPVAAVSAALLVPFFVILMALMVLSTVSQLPTPCTPLACCSTGGRRLRWTPAQQAPAGPRWSLAAATT